MTDLAEPYLITGAGDVIRVYDVSSLQEPELINEVDAHSHDVTDLHLWVRKTVGADSKTRVEPWIVSSSLDGTIRKWRLAGKGFIRLTFSPNLTRTSDLLSQSPPPPRLEPPKSTKAAPAAKSEFEMTEDEERELAELLEDD